MAEMCSVKKNITQYQFEKTKQYQFMQNTRKFPKISNVSLLHQKPRSF